MIDTCRKHEPLALVADAAGTVCALHVQGSHERLTAFHLCRGRRPVDISLLGRPRQGRRRDLRHAPSRPRLGLSHLTTCRAGYVLRLFAKPVVM